MRLLHEARLQIASYLLPHTILMYANDLASLNEGTINHSNDGLF